ncbi:hypothetical protein ACOMHN_017710 [Nucella lapillus]
MEENEKWHASVPTSNQFSVLDPEQNPNPQVSHPPPSSPSPFDRLMKKPIPISCDELLLGDSVLCAIGEGPSSHNASAKNLSVPGLTVSHLLKWLLSLRPFPHIRRHQQLHTKQPRRRCNVATRGEGNTAGLPPCRAEGFLHHPSIRPTPRL